MIDLRQLLEDMLKRNATDLHLTVGVPPMLRIDGELTPAGDEVLNSKMTQYLIYSILTEKQKKIFETTKELDFSFGIKNLSRFRGNIFLQRGNVAAAIRRIPFEFLSFKQLGLPPIIEQLAERPRGLVLVTGPTGSGKSTTLASMINKINQERREHIITIEDPIEYLHSHKKCIVNQRAVYEDTESFANALKSILRQDPDIVLIGEMRTKETIELGLTIAETGHLTFATLHTNSCAESINRIIDVFPAGQQPQIRAQLSFVLQGVLTQQLLPKKRGGGRCLALEIMVCTPAIRALIRDSKIHQIYSSMQAGRKYGMQTLNMSLYELFVNGLISKEIALERSGDRAELKKMIARGGTST